MWCVRLSIPSTLPRAICASKLFCIVRYAIVFILFVVAVARELVVLPRGNEVKTVCDFCPGCV